MLGERSHLALLPTDLASSGALFKIGFAAAGLAQAQVPAAAEDPSSLALEADHTVWLLGRHSDRRGCRLSAA